jgi:hypothetical protein
VPWLHVPFVFGLQDVHPESHRGPRRPQHLGLIKGGEESLYIAGSRGTSRDRLRRQRLAPGDLAFGRPGKLVSRSIAAAYRPRCVAAPPNGPHPGQPRSGRATVDANPARQDRTTPRPQSPPRVGRPRCSCGLRPFQNRRPIRAGPSAGLRRGMRWVVGTCFKSSGVALPATRRLLRAGAVSRPETTAGPVIRTMANGLASYDAVSRGRAGRACWRRSDPRRPPNKRVAG